MVALAVVPIPDRIDREAYIRECLGALADELYQIAYEPSQDAWVALRDCPWCRLLESKGHVGLMCPICEQIVRAVFEEDP